MPFLGTEGLGQQLIGECLRVWLAASEPDRTVGGRGQALHFRCPRFRGAALPGSDCRHRAGTAPMLRYTHWRS